MKRIPAWIMVLSPLGGLFFLPPSVRHIAIFMVAGILSALLWMGAVMYLIKERTDENAD